MKTRVIVTGMDAITPVGNDVESSWQGPKDKTVEIGSITYFDTTECKCKLAAEVKGFNPKQYMGAKAAYRMGTFSQFAVAVSKEALKQSGIDTEKKNPYRVGICMGSGIGSLQAMGKGVKKLNDKGPSRVNPLLVPLMINSMAAGNVTIQFGLEGECFNVVTTYVTRTHFIGEAFRSIQYGEADVMVASGAEANITPIGIAEFTSLTVLNTTEGVPRTSTPFDENRNGFVIGEEAGVVVLGSPEHIKARGASVLAEAVGYGATYDAFHITSPAENGSGVAHIMENAMKGAGITTEDVNYVSAHDTSTHHSDLFEAKAVKLALEDHAREVKINSTKSVIGHLPGAAGGVEFITCVKLIQNGFVHTTAGLRKSGEDCGLDYTMGDDVFMNVGVAISNSLGFSGRNASLIVKEFSE